ncbi:MAG: hypothetical protein M1480_14685 [Bacteroidetes bacterium]|nr:hypothetical protein [Bacteroidota bacterium]
MNFKEVENQKKLISEVLTHVSGKTKLFEICSFYSSLIDANDKNLINAYSLDFIYELLSELKSFTPFFQKPEKTESLLSLLNKIKQIDTLKSFVDELNANILHIETSLSQLKNILNGTEPVSQKQMLSFPLLESVSNINQQDSFGVLESFSVRITKNKNQNKFIFVPSEKKIEERLLLQAENSFQLALNYFHWHKKRLSKFHEVLIYFENHTASYEGNSLGAALTIAFIERLSLIYNLPYVTRIKGNIAVTGGVDETGNIISVSSEMCRKKVELVFYSDIDTFVVPKADEEHARNKIAGLNKSYSNRKLNLVAVEGIYDLLNRRDLIDIKKQPVVVRAAKGIRKNWFVSTLSVILLLILSFLWINNYDDNPFTYELEQNQIVIKNKYNRSLWEIDYQGGGEYIKKMKWAPALETYFRILDVNGDGKNEILFCYASNSKYSNASYSDGLVLFNWKGEILWRRGFRKDLFSRREHLTPPYSISIFDTLKINNNPCIICCSNNVNSYVSAAYILDLSANKVISDTLWSPGFINDIRVIKGINGNEKEILVLSCNNSFQKNCLSKLMLNELKGQLLVTNDYKFLNIREAKVLNCFLFPNSDYNSFSKQRMNGTVYRSLTVSKEAKTIRFSINEDSYEILGKVFYNWHYDTNEFEISIGNDFRVMRDSLVAHGELPLPYTDTKEYREKLRKQILAWDGDKFIPLDEYVTKRAAQK